MLESKLQHKREIKPNLSDGRYGPPYEGAVQDDRPINRIPPRTHTGQNKGFFSGMLRVILHSVLSYTSDPSNSRERSKMV